MATEISAKIVKELRDKTSAGMMDCKKALQEADGDFAKAEEALKKKGLATADKKSDRIATEGIVEAYIHMGGKLGVLVEVICFTVYCVLQKSATRSCDWLMSSTQRQY